MRAGSRHFSLAWLAQQLTYKLYIPDYGKTWRSTKHTDTHIARPPHAMQPNQYESIQLTTFSSQSTLSRFSDPKQATSCTKTRQLYFIFFSSWVHNTNRSYGIIVQKINKTIIHDCRIDSNTWITYISNVPVSSQRVFTVAVKSSSPRFHLIE